MEKTKLKYHVDMPSLALLLSYMIVIDIIGQVNKLNSLMEVSDAHFMVLFVSLLCITTRMSNEHTYTIYIRSEVILDHQNDAMSIDGDENRRDTGRVITISKKKKLLLNLWN